jgi:hypothetical protein
MLNVMTEYCFQTCVVETPSRWRQVCQHVHRLRLPMEQLQQQHSHLAAIRSMYPFEAISTEVGTTMPQKKQPPH